MNKKVIAVLSLGGLLVASVAGAQMIRGNYYEAGFETLAETKPFEIRRYEPRIIAETTVNASSLEQATSRGFERLAGYIFGGNKGDNGTSQKIAMTTPVESAPTDDGEFVIVFTMPSEYSLDELPKPNDARVRLREETQAVVATARFSGNARKKNLGALSRDLLGFVEAQGYEATSSVKVAQYDPPWTPGFLRRNELMVDVKRIETSAP